VQDERETCDDSSERKQKMKRSGDAEALKQRDETGWNFGSIGSRRGRGEKGVKKNQNVKGKKVARNEGGSRGSGVSQRRNNVLHRNRTLGPKGGQ